MYVCADCGAAVPGDGHWSSNEEKYFKIHQDWHKNLDEKYKLLLKSLYKDILDLEVAVAQLPSVIEAKQMEGETNA